MFLADSEEQFLPFFKSSVYIYIYILIILMIIIIIILIVVILMIRMIIIIMMIMFSSRLWIAGRGIAWSERLLSDKGKL